jgi:hypothetical protein
MRTICNTIPLIEEAVAWCIRCELLAVDVETIPHRKPAKGKTWSAPFVMTVVSYTGIDKQGYFRSYAFQLTRSKSATDYEHPLAQRALLAIARINACPVRKTMHYGNYDCAWFVRYAVPPANYAYDSATLWWARYPDLPKTLAFVSSILLDNYRYWKMGRKEEDFTNHTMYAMEDTESTLFCTIRLLEWMLEDVVMRANFWRAHLRNLTGLSMSLKGMAVDQDMFDGMRVELQGKADEALKRLRFLVADATFNPNSAPAKKELFYGLLGAQPRNAKGRILKRLTGNAKISIGAIVLRSLKSEHPLLRRIVEALQEAQEPAKQISNVIGLEFYKSRLHTGYDGIGTTTTRLSSRKDAFNFGSNVQNIRKKFRRFIRAEKKKRSFILEGDFSAADDVFISYESQEPKKIEIIERGLDTHSFNAAEVFFPHWEYNRVVKGKEEYLDAAKTIKNPDYDLVTHPITGIRQITKKGTHAANYLMAGHTFFNTAGREAIVGAAKHLGHTDAGLWTTNQLIEFCDWLDGRYRNYYPRFARAGSHSFYAELSIGLRTHRSYETIFGYTQRFLADPMADSTLRACAATAGQANTAGRVNMAMMELDQGIRQIQFRDGDAPDADEPALPVSESEHGSSLRLQTHDSLDLVVDADHANYREGVQRFFHVLRRPVVCKGRLIKLGLEVDVAIHLNHKAVVVHNPEDVFRWVESNWS